jgi:outer membrane protein TolC
MHYYFDVKQPMFRGFTLVNAVMQETYNKRASRAEILQAVNDAALNTIISYFELTRAEGIYANHEELGREAARLLDQSERRKTKGIISEIEYLNVRSLVGEIEQEKEALLGDREVAAIELKKNLRLPPDEPIEIEPVYDTGSYDPKRLEEKGREREEEAGKIKIREARTLDDFIVLAYQHRPDLKMEENKLTATRYAEKIAKGGWLPRSDLSLKMGQDAQTLRPAFERPPFKNEWSVMVETSWNLAGNTLKHNYSNTDTPPSFTTFQGSSGTTRLNNTFSAQLLDGLKQYADVHQAKAQTAEQLKAYEDMEQQTVRDVVEAFYKYRSSLIRLRATAAGMEYRRRGAALSLLKLGKNEIQISEYLEALRELAIQRDDYQTAMADYFDSKAKLNHAVGIQNFVPVDDLADVRMSK